MNNSSLTIDSVSPDPVDALQTKLGSEEARILKIIEALREVQQVRGWETLETEVFDNLLNILERQLREEAAKEDPDPKKLNRLSGELKWAEKYSDLSKLENQYLVQLQNIRLRLHGSEQPGD